MAPRTIWTIATLRAKRDEVEKAIAIYERRLAQARADYDHLTGSIALFSATGDINLLFQRGEALAIVKQALRNGPMTLKQMVDAIMDAKGYDTGDVITTRTLFARMRNVLYDQSRRGALIGEGKRKNAWLWRLP